MLSLLLLTLLSPIPSTGEEPPSTEWKLIERPVEKFMFPIKDYILEVKSLRPDVYNTNPAWNELSAARTSMILELHDGSWQSRVGRMVWNTIKYDMGRDVLIEQCTNNYQPYRSFPAGGKKEQIWAWHFNPEDIELTCDGELQYSKLFSEGEVDPRRPGLPEKCQELGAASVDRIILKFMEGCYIRAVPKLGELRLPAPLSLPTCDCWHPRCGYCSSLECTIEQDLSSSDQGVQVTSKVRWRKVNSLVLYDQAGSAIGKFHWSRSRVILSGGCIQCSPPSSVRRLRGITTWSFTLKKGVVQVWVKGAVVYERKLVGECAERYGRVRRFAFYNMGCENSFRVTHEMIPGDMVTENCGGMCSAE